MVDGRVYGIIANLWPDDSKAVHPSSGVAVSAEP